MSRSNTPEPASRADSRSSSMYDDTLKMEMAAIKEPRGAPFGRQPRASHVIASDTPRTSTSTERTRSTEHPSSRPGTHEAVLSRPQRSEYPPSSIAKYSSALPTLTRQDSGVSTIEAIEAIYDAAGPIRFDSEHLDADHGVTTNGISCHSSSEGSESDPVATSAPRLLSQQSRPRQKSSDFDLMHSHRMSLAAETGQLAPRRRAGPSGEWASITHAQRPSTASEPQFLKQRQRSRSPTEGQVQTWSHSNSSSKFNALPAAVRRSSLPDVTPFATFCKTAPSSPLPEIQYVSGTSRVGTIDWSEDTRNIMTATTTDQNGEIPLVTLPAPTQLRDPTVPTSEDQLPPKQKSFEHRASAVIRGHGTGFEILKQGTFTRAPPISLQNGSRSRSSSIESRRKLQKKRQPSEESQKGPSSRASLV